MVASIDLDGKLEVAQDHSDVIFSNFNFVVQFVPQSVVRWPIESSREQMDSGMERERERQQ